MSRLTSDKRREESLIAFCNLGIFCVCHMLLSLKFENNGVRKLEFVELLNYIYVLVYVLFWWSFVRKKNHHIFNGFLKNIYTYMENG
jgi:hypothetical protein